MLMDVLLLPLLVVPPPLLQRGHLLDLLQGVVGAHGPPVVLDHLGPVRIVRGCDDAPR